MIDDTSYLLINLGQMTSSVLQSEVPVECLNITFKPEFAEDVLRSLVTPSDKLLDAPTLKSAQPVEFFVRSYPHDEILSPQLFKLRSRLGTEALTQGWLEEQFHILAGKLLYVHRNVLKEVDTMSAVRQSTRIECYQRLHRAKDYMNAKLNHPLSLAAIAGQVYLAPHHFLRMFKQAFGETPHQYLTRIRLERAKYLLRKTTLSVTSICIEVGFDSLGSFSWLFRRRFGLSPSEYRAEITGRIVLVSLLD